ncbi:hypothetical protein [Pelosinus sp. UFO1]|uniref:hypothetical protein n=1 Tax=Pelosinus sp. UFO1 TaxID=484770 RepID=UPI0004D13A6B|nr:hypothetical protein [Pelosinus sp. UFO1]AIF52013.1 hypothetical protein UFO1_2466 [Pelosinus sp. UFO1]
MAEHDNGVCKRCQYNFRVNLCNNCPEYKQAVRLAMNRMATGGIYTGDYLYHREHSNVNPVFITINKTREMGKSECAGDNIIHFME